MRATQHFHRGLLLGTTQIKRKEIQRNTLKYFWSFWFFVNKQIKREQQNREKLFTRESSQQEKQEQGNLFGFFFLVLLLSMVRK